MPNRSKEDQARALEQLSGGQMPAEGEAEGRDEAVAPEASKPGIEPRPVGPVRPAAPAGQLSPVGRPSQPPGTAAPRLPRPTEVPALSNRPAAPPPPDEVESQSQPPLSLETGVDDDDAVIVPAPDPRVFHHKSTPAGYSQRLGGFGRSLTFRRTFIPILLTGGLICLALATIHFITWGSGDNPLRGLPGWLVGLLFLFAAVLWGLAVINMMVVKHMLEPKGEPAPP